MESEALEGQKGLSQERLAFDSEIDRAYVGGLERQTENPTVDLLDRLAATLEAPLSEFFRKPELALRHQAAQKRTKGAVATRSPRRPIQRAATSSIDPIIHLAAPPPPATLRIL